MLKKTVTLALLLKLFSAGSGLALSIVLTRILGSETAAVYFFGYSLISIASTVVRFGSDNVTIKVLPAYLSKNESQEIYNYIVCVYVSIGIVYFTTSIFFLLAWGIVPEVFGNFSSYLPAYVAWLLPYSVLMATSFMIRALGGVYVSLFLNGILLSALMTSGLVAVQYTLYGESIRNLDDSGSLVTDLFLICLIFSAVIAFFYLFRLLLKENVELFFQRESMLKRVKELSSVARPYFITSVVTVFSVNIGNIMVGALLGAKEVSYYAVAVKLATVSSILLSGVNAVVAPKFSSLYSLRKMGELERLLKRSCRFTALIGFPVTLLMFVFPQRVLSIFGGEFVLAENILLILVLGQYINCATGPVSYLLQMTGNEKLFMRISVFNGIISVFLTYFLVKVFGLIGAAYAASMSVIFINVFSVFAVKRRLGFYIF